ncbi:lysine--tRNA ligase [Candidatus Saccharibacteria bacterium]|nr:lysine--tRNA ligase [Candidatus Saccharibacteria bacterium]
MFWLNKIIDDILAAHPEGEVIVESGSAPSGSYHIGHLREIITCDAIVRELQKRGRQAKQIHFSDDLDALRKIPVNVPAEFEKYLGQSLCDIPAPEGEGTYAEYFLKGFIKSADKLDIQMEIIRSHEKYREGFFTPAIEKSLENIPRVKAAMESIAGRKLADDYSPIQINEESYLKKRAFVSLDKEAKTVTYLDKEGQEQNVSYADGMVKLDWRLDWPARWWLMNVQVEPFGRDHASSGGSYATGAAICREVFEHEPPMPVPYDFINRAGDTKKMSASKGTGIEAAEAVEVLPPEILRFFVLKYPPQKRLYFDSEQGISKLIDEFAEIMGEQPDSQILYLSRAGLDPTVSRIPFTHLVASYQGALKDIEKTLQILSRTESAEIVSQNQQIIREELAYIDKWLEKWAPEELRFNLLDNVDSTNFDDSEKSYLSRLADKIEQAPEAADGEWFHKAIYSFKESDSLTPQQLFGPLYRALIGKEAGPRAGWFLSILPRTWLIKRLRLEA